MLIRFDDYQNVKSEETTVSLRCPSCRQLGTFEILPGIYDTWKEAGMYTLGQRRCPNTKCRTQVFFVEQAGQVLVSYPAQRLDFDTTDIPGAIVESFDEALTCHAHQCFVAAAIMVRKTLEDICRDRGAAGPNLKARLQALGTKVVLPQELLAALDDLRLLGNDAAHVESETFSQVGEAEIEAAIAVTKEVLKGVYQYAALLQQLRALKK